mgnify:CR=1 FL=1
MSRRRFVTALGSTAITVAPARAHAGTGATRALRLDKLRINEKLSLEYFAAGRYLLDALSADRHRTAALPPRLAQTLRNRCSA